MSWRLLRILAALVALSCAACIQPISGDSGDGGGTDAGANGGEDGGTSGGDGGGQGDGGAEDAGEQGDGGTGTDGGTAVPPLTWGKMVAPAITHGLNAISGNSKNNVYATGDLGAIYRYDGNTWTKLTQSPGNLALFSIYVAPDGSVFAAGGSQLVHCRSGCTAASDFTWTTATHQLTGVCGRDSSTVYATGVGGSGSSTNAGVLYKFDATSNTWSRLSADTGSFFNVGCFVAESGAVFLSAQATVVRFENSTFTSEVVNYPSTWDISTRAQQIYEAVWGSGTTLFAAGYRRGIITRNAAGTWDLVQQPDGVNDHHALAGSGPSDVVVGGTRSGDNRYFRTFDGTTWSTPAQAPNLDIWGLTAIDSKTFFAVGTNSGIDGAVWIGTRP